MPGTTDVRIGGSKRFECQVVGFPRPIIRWYKNGIDITKNKRFKFDFSEEGVISMIIENITYKDEGCYRCKAENSEGLASTAAYLYVLSPSLLNDEDDTTSVHSMDVVDADFTEYELRKQAEVQKQTIERLLSDEIKFHEEALGFSLEEFNAEDALAERLTFETSAIKEEIYVEKVAEESQPSGPPAFTYDTGVGQQKEYEIEAEDKPGILVEVEVQESTNQGEKDEEKTAEPEPEPVEKKLLLAGLEEAAVVLEEVIQEPEPEPAKVEEKVEEPTPLPPGAHVHADGTVCSHGVWRFKHLEVAGKKKRAYATDIVHDDTNLSKEATTIPVPAEKKEEKMDGKSAKHMEASKEVESVYGRKSKYSMKEESFMSREESLSIIQTGLVSDGSSVISQTVTEAVSSQSVSIIGGQQAIEGGQSMTIQVSDLSVSGSIMEETGGSAMKIFSSDVDTGTSVMKAFIDKSDLMLRAEVSRVSTSPESSMSVESVTVEEEFKTFLDKTSKRPMGIESGILTRQISNVEEVVEMRAETIVVEKSGGAKEDSTLNQMSVFGKSETKTELMESKILIVAEEIQIERTTQASEVITETREARTQETITEMKTEEISKKIDEVALDFDKDKKIDIKVEQMLEAEVEFNSASVTETEETDALVTDTQSLVNITEEEEVTAHKEAVDEGLTTSEVEAPADEGLDISLDEVQLPEEMKPVIISFLRDVTVTEGSKVCLEFEVTGYPAPTCTWYQDRRVITDSAERITTQTRSRSMLEIFEATVKSSGTYTFTMENALGKASTDVYVLVTAKPTRPVITNKSQDISITQGDALSIDFTVSGSPPPDVKWFMNTTEIKEKRAVIKKIGERYTLTIKEAVISDSGSYSLKATNEAGEASADVMVTVSEPKVTPKVSKGPKAVTTKQGETISIEFQISGNPTPVIEWQKDGIKLLTDTRISSRLEEDRVVLAIKDSTPADSGKYTVIAENDVGKSSQSVNVTVSIPDSPPTITPKGPTTVDVKAGETIRAEFLITGNPTPVIEWQKDGIKLLTDTRISSRLEEDRVVLAIKDSTPADSGKYTVIAENDVGKSSQSVNVTVSIPDSPPTITPKGPTTVDVKAGETIRAEFLITGNPTPVIEWQKDGIKLLTDTRISSRLEEDRVVLAIKDSTPADSGKYTVIAENDVGKSSQSVNVTVSIPDSPPTITPKGPTTVDVKAGETIRAEFLITGSPVPTVEWQKDSVCLETNNRILTTIQEESAIMEINDSVPSDSGRYSMITTNIAGSLTQIIDIVVAAPQTAPTITKGAKEVNVKEGETIHMEFKVTGSPRPDGHWSKDGAVLQLSNRVKASEKDETFSLEIADSVSADSGTYTLMTDNLAGQTSQDVSIMVTLADVSPRITKCSPSVDIHEGQDIHLEVTISGTPSPDVQWSKNGTKLEASKRVSLTQKDVVYVLDIPNSLSSDSGTYTVTLKNPVGEASHDVSVMVTIPEVPPSIVKSSPSISISEGQDVHVEFIVAGTPAPEVTWSKDGTPIRAAGRISTSQNGDAYVLDIPSADASDSGMYTLTAMNPAGEVSQDVSVTVMIRDVLPCVIKCSPSVNIMEGEDIQLEVTVNGTPVPEAVWLRDGASVKKSKRISTSQAGETHILLIPKAVATDSAIYTLTAKNPAGETSHDISVTVTIPDVSPSITKSSPVIKVTEGQVVHIEAIVSGTPEPDVKWSKDGSMLKESRRVLVSRKEETVVLEILEGLFSDNGTYTLTATNRAGEVSQDVSVTVSLRDVPPSIVKASPSVTITEGQDVHLDMTINGTPAPEITWSKDGKDIKKTDRVSTSQSNDMFTLDILKSQPSDSGTYHVTAKSAVGEISHDIVVTVTLADVPPRIVKSSPNVGITEGHNVYIEVTVAGMPEPDIKWTKDGSKLQESSRVSMSRKEESIVLEIPEGLSSDSGTYTLTATNRAGEVSQNVNVAVILCDVPPSIVTASPSVTVTEGQDVHLDMTIKGTPAPEITWSKDGKSIKKTDRVLTSQSDDTFTLDILKSEPSDSGTYHVTAKNPAGETSHDIVVTVILADVPPRIVKSSPNVSIKEGHNVYIEVTVAGTPEPDVKWTKDGSKVKESGRVLMTRKDEMIVLEISEGLSSDSGTYTLTATNRAGEVSQDVSITVTLRDVSPSIVKASPSVTVTVGQDVHLEMTIKGSPAPDISWSKDGNDIKKTDRVSTSQSDDMFTLDILKCQTSDSGTYHVTAKNPAGEISHDISVIVTLADIPPSIVKSSPNISVIEGQDVHIEVTVAGTPAPDISWSKDGVGLKKSDRVMTAQKNETFVLEISKSLSSDSGTYTLTAKNPAGEVTHDVSITVTVPDVPPSIVESSPSLSVMEGQDVHVEVTVQGKPAPEGKWSKDGSGIKKGSRVATSEKGDTFVLDIPKALNSDTGTYTLTVKNSAGQTSQDVNVIVSIPLIAPSITRTPSSISVTEGETIHAEFTVKGDPEPEAKWTKDGQDLKKSTRIALTQKKDVHVLEISKATTADCGTYKLNITNPAGETSADVLIEVTVPQPPTDCPSIVASPGEVKVTEGQELHLEVTVKGKPAPEGKWSKDGSGIKKGSRVATSEKGDTFVLDIPKALNSDTGTYTLTVKNSAGQTSQDVNVIVSIPLIAPSITRTPSSISVTDGDTIHAEFTVKGDPEPEAKWTKDGLDLKKSTRIALTQKKDVHVLEISKATTADCGTYKLNITNPAGETSADVLIEVTVPQPPTDSPSIVASPGEVKVTEGQELHLEVTVKGKPAPEGKWSKDGSGIKKGSRVATSEKGDTFVLDIPKALNSDTGTYTLTVKNSAGQTSQDVNVIVSIPLIAPSITRTPSSISVTDGDTIHAEFTVKGDPEPEAKWTKDGQDLKKSTRIALTQKKDVHVLEISKATTADCGTYKLNITNPAGETSADVLIEVTVPQPPTDSPSIVASPGEVKVTEGQELHLEVTVKGKPAPEGKWSKDGSGIKKGSHVVTSEKGDTFVLDIPKALNSDTGTYTLTVKNSAGQTSQDVNVTVSIPLIAPSITRTPSSICVTEGETIHAEFTVKGDPEPEAKWTKDGLDLKKSTRIALTQKKDVHVLEISKATTADCGTYKLNITNPAGETSADVLIEVTVPQPPTDSPSIVASPGEVKVTEGQELHLAVTVNAQPSPDFHWMKDGKALRLSERITLKDDGEKATFTIKKAEESDSGTYTLVAQNPAGKTTSDISVSVTLPMSPKQDEGVTKDAAPESSEPDNLYLKEYVVLAKHKDKDTSVTLPKGDIVEILDSKNPELWLVRRKDKKDQVCFVPASNVKPMGEDEVDSDAAGGQKKKKRKLPPALSKKMSSGEKEGENEDEDHQRLKKLPTEHVVVADHSPSGDDPENLKLVEGDSVDALDTANPEHWLVCVKATKTEPERLGWVPACYLDPKASPGSAARTSREAFREEVLQITNKQQEATVKRSSIDESDSTLTQSEAPAAYAVTELLETEREYLRDVQLLRDHYIQSADDLAIVKDNKETIFRNLDAILGFHNDTFLNELTACTVNPGSIGKLFLNFKDKFEQYVPFGAGQPAANASLSIPEVKAFFEEVGKKQGDADNLLQEYMQKPLDRIQQYLMVLKDILRYTSRAREPCQDVEQAILMLIGIQQRIHDLGLLAQLKGYHGDVTTLGQLIRHADLTYWDTLPADSEGKESHLFLFPDRILVTKEEKPSSTEGPAFIFQSEIELPKIQLNDIYVPEEDLRFELWYAEPEEQYLSLQGKSAQTKKVWLKDLREALQKLGVQETDIMPERRSMKAASLEVPTPPSPKEAELEIVAPEDVMPEEEKAPKPEAEVEPTPEPEKPEAAPKSEEADVVEPNPVTPELEPPKEEEKPESKEEPTAVEKESTPVAKEPTPPKEEPKPVEKESTPPKEEPAPVAKEPTPPKEEPKPVVKESTPPIEEPKPAVKEPTPPKEEPKPIVKEPTPPKEEPKPVVKEPTPPKEPKTVVKEPSPSPPKQEPPKEETKPIAKEPTPPKEEPKAEPKPEPKVTLTAPTCPEKMDNCQVEEGRLARFDCRVVAYPEPEITWVRDGKIVKPGGRFQLMNPDDATYALLIKDAQISDSGLYKCWARNKYGEASTEGELIVSALSDADQGREHTVPMFLSPLQKVEAREGRSVELRCSIAGFPQPNITWQVDGREIKQAKEFQMRFHNDDCILAIKEAYPEDSGIYTCRLVNPMGEVSCSAQVLIKPDLTKKDKEAPPKFVRKFYDTETKKGNDFEFECAVHGDPTPTVTWQYKGKPIQESRRCKIKADGSKYSLKIRDAEWDDEGDYTCTAKNSQGSISCKAYLSVTEAKVPPKPAQLVAKVQKEEGFAPTFTKRLRDVDAVEGRKAKFECRVMGEPEPIASWEKDGKPYSKNPRAEMGLVDGDKHYLIINDSTKEDSGEYTITLTNKLGKATTSGMLYVGEPRTKSYAPRFTPPPGEETEYQLMPPTTRPYRSLFAKGGIPTLPYDKPTLLDVRRDSVRLSWLPVLIPLLPEDEKPCTYIVEYKEASGSFWTKIATDLKGNSHLATNLNPDDEYLFRVRAENKMGISEPTTPVLLVKRSVPERKEVTVEDYLGPMGIPEHKPFVSEYGTESMRLSWKPPKMPAAAKDLAPLSYRLEQQQLPGTDWMPLGGHIPDNSYYVHNLNPDQDYNFRVRSENRYGISLPTSALSLQRASTYAGSPIMRPTIMELDSDSVMLSWRRVDVPVHQIDDEPLTYLIEMQSPPQPDWLELARRIPSTTYKVKGLKMDQDYNFRIRAQTMRGLSAPSPPISLYKTLANVRSPVSDINVDYDLDSIRLNWTSVNIPPYHLDEQPLLYVLEMQDNRLSDWRPLASGIPTTSYRFSGPSPSPDSRVRVRAMTEYGLSPPTAPVHLSREGRRPLEDLKIIRTEPEAVHLSWRPILIPDSDEPIKYAVEFQEHPQTDWRVLTRGLVGTNYRAAGLSPTKDYSFRVRADTITRLHEPSASVSVYKSPVPPRLPLHEPVISDVGASSLRLSWRPADFPVYLRNQIPLAYTVEMQELPQNTWRPIKHNILQTNYLVPDIQPNRDYKFRVLATSEYGSSEPSLPVLLYRKPVPTLPIQEPLISEIKGESAKLSWQPASLPDHLSGRDTPFTYRIEVQEPPSNTWMPLYKNIRTCDYHLTKLRPDKDYVYRIRAESEFGLSEPSQPVYIARRAVPPRIPRDQPYVIDMKPDSVTLSWRAVELPVHILDYSPITYLLEVQDAPGSHWLPLARRIPQTSYRIPNLKPNQDYTFRVRAENDYGVSEPTLPLLLKRRAVVPVMPKEEPLISDVRPGSIRLSWRPANLPSYLRDSMPILYSIYIQDTPLNTWTPIVKRVAHSSHYITNLQPDKDYYFRVQAENEYGSSEPTLPVRLSREPSPRVPVDTPEIVGFEPSALKLSWKRRPHFETHAKPLSYQLEVEEPHSRDWRKVAGGIRDTSYTVSGLEPRHDYRFRVRGETDIGLTEPSVPVTFDRSRLHPSVPIERPDLFDIQPTSARLSWRRIYIPPYDRPDIQLRYLVEYKELGHTQWRSLVSRIPETSYHVTGLDAKKDYMFRVRAETDELGLSDPTPYVPLYRKSVIPHVPVSLPTISDVGHDYVGLRWNKVHVPTFGLDDEPLKFMVEQRELSCADWSPVARGITDTSYRVGGLKSNRDYQFRVRGESSYAVTEPASAVSFYRKSVYPGVPIARPEILDDEDDPDYLRLSWNRAYIPPYDRHDDSLRYSVEVQEPPSLHWRPLVTDLATTSYSTPRLEPMQDYLFRIRAQLAGITSEPTAPLPYFRAKSSPRLALLPPDYRATPPPAEEGSGHIRRPYMEALAVKVPPRLPLERPDLSDIQDDTVRLSWKPATVPDSIRHKYPLTYTIEVRQPPHFDWSPAAQGIQGLSHRVHDLNPNTDYVFRIRAINEFGISEATVPTSLRRTKDGATVEDDDDDYAMPTGEMAPPRLPMDTPLVHHDEPSVIVLTWSPARNPAYVKPTPITYTIEVREIPSSRWLRLAGDLTDTKHRITGLIPNKEYSFRVIAETEYGCSEPTLSATVGKSKAPLRKSSSVDRDEDLLRPSSSYLDSLELGAAPRAPHGKPIITVITVDHVTLRWSPARLPAYTKHTPVTYIIEARELPNPGWTLLEKNIAGISFDVRDLRPDQDYMFRVRAQNEHGSSEPTLPASLYRETEYHPEARSSPSRNDSQAVVESTAPKVTFDSPERTGDSIRRHALAPVFKPADSETQYGIENRPVKLSLEVDASPVPDVWWFFEDDKIEYGGRYNTYLSPSGLLTLEIGNMTWKDVGKYKCYAENDYGLAVRIVSLDMADPPTFIEPLKDVTFVTRGSGQIACRIDGIPYPTVRWNKDWHPIGNSARVGIRQEAPDYWSLSIDNAISMDGGLYECIAENIAGKVHCTAKVVVQDNLPAPSDMIFKNMSVHNRYHILEEVGRGRHGVVRRVIEKSTGCEFAAKFIRVHNERDKDVLRHELETMRMLSHKNIPTLQDAYESPRQLVLVSELVTGGELLDRVLSEDRWTENEVAYYVRQLLDILTHLHKTSILHLDVKPANIHFASRGSDEIKLLDFGFARKLIPNKDLILNYGTPEFTSPEVVVQQPVTKAADMWAVGSLAYLLLTGISPFKSATLQDTLAKIQGCDWNFSPDAFENVSKEAKDFISKLLIREPMDRLSVEECRDHSWIKLSSMRGQGLKINLDNMREYQTRSKRQRIQSAVKTTARFHSLSSISSGPLSPERSILQPEVDPKTGNVIFPDSEVFSDFLDHESWNDGQTKYQQGPDTILLPLSDTEYSLRLRRYQNARGMQPTDYTANDDLDLPVDLEAARYRMMRERRILSDVSREELSSHVSDREVEWLEASEELKNIKQQVGQQTKSTQNGSLPLFKEKVKDQAFTPGDDVMFKCHVVSTPSASVSWYRNEELLTDGSRVRIALTDVGRASLTIFTTKPHDVGIYKCVCRNKYGNASCRARLVVGDTPGRPDRPVVVEISSSQALVLWDAPESDGNQPIIHYRIDYKMSGDARWMTACYTISECAVVDNLLPDEAYRFRVSCMNSFGNSSYSWSSVLVRTKPEGSQPLSLDPYTDTIIQRSSQADLQPSPFGSEVGSEMLSISGCDTEEEEREKIAEPRETNPGQHYSFTDEVWKGSYSNIKSCINKMSHEDYVTKQLSYSPDRRPEVLREYSILHGLHQERIINLIEGFVHGNTHYLILEKLYGENVARQLSYRNRYSEEMIVGIVRQILDGLEYLHHVGIAHLNLQPGSVIMLSRRRLDVKLIDFSLAQHVGSSDEVSVPRAGYPDFMAPEVITQEAAGTGADIWGVGVIVFLLLSGQSPFGGKTAADTMTNIAYNRYNASELFENVTTEALKFIFMTLKRVPRNRLTASECLNHKWLQLSDKLIKSRSEAVFLTHKLRRFVSEYELRRLNPDYVRSFPDFSLTAPTPPAVTGSTT